MRATRAAITVALTIGMVSSARLASASPHSGFEQYRRSVVAVTYSVETSVMREVREVAGRDVGVLVGKGLVLLNGTVATSSSTGAQPHDFRVRFANGEERDATLVGRDEFANLAFVELAGDLPAGAVPLPLGGKKTAAVGERVYALGLLPENLDPMVRLTEGRIVATVERPKSLVITDLAVEDALGGPVFTENGTLLGVLSELGEAGPSFAQGLGGDNDRTTGLIVDLPTIARLVQAPPRKGELRRSWLGITLQALDKDKAEYWKLGDATGIIVNSVMAGSPAALAGLQEGDIVVTMDGAKIPVNQDEHVPIFVEQIGSRPVGSKMRLGVVRQGRRIETTVDLVAAPKSRADAEMYHSEEFEFTVRELVFQDYRNFDLKPGFKGVLVNKIEEGGWAGVGGLETGDIIQKVDDREIVAPDDVKTVLAEAVTKQKRKLVFFVQRGGRTQFITVQPNWGQS